ncbi:MAG: pirin family protein [Gammaproteobacteria bacterium]|nr:pirin family protein [Gammaproteobacteria bacterium]
MPTREITAIVDSRPATDGAGVKINRLAGFDGGSSMDPFLMLDEIRSDRREEFEAGFPPHPHRGFETVTYMREGGFAHTDSMGNTGTITPGGAQWMTAGSGVIHSEMPGPDADRIHGFQLWLNLPAREKMQPPAYRDIQGDDVVTRESGYATLRLIAGTLTLDGETIDGVVTGRTTRPLIADIGASRDASVSIGVDDASALQLFVYAGAVEAGGRRARAGQLARLGDGSVLELSLEAGSGALLFGGEPINEPVVHHGPFVMSTADEIAQAMRDYRDGTLVRG